MLKHWVFNLFFLFYYELMKILGIDPGTHRIGFAVLEKEKSNLGVIDYGCVEVREKEKSEQLRVIFERIDNMIKVRKPDLMAVEDLFFFKNQKTALSVAQARGVIVLAGAVNGLLVLEPTPLQVKQALCGYGRASKRQIQEMIKRVFKLKEIPKPDDAADALAVAFYATSYKKFN